MLSTLAFAGMIVATMGHGRLIKPLTRVGHTNYENDPIGFGGRPANQFVCRHDFNDALTPDVVEAGGTLNVQWVTTAAHVGDCSLYMSYDGQLPLEDMRWFKIANKQDCKSLSGKDVKIELPNWLPGGNAVLRWEWAALHVSPTIEFYAQCTDIEVDPDDHNEISIDDIPMFKVFENGQKTSLPLNGNEGVGFRNPFATSNQYWSESNPASYMTGPACALDLENSLVNDCYLTAPGQQGHMNMNGAAPIVQPTDPPTEPPVDQPVEAPTQKPVDSPVTIPTQQPVESPVANPTYPPVTVPTQKPVESPVTNPTQPPVDGECTTPLLGRYAQCAGEGFVVNNPNGCPLCPSGFDCYRRNNGYSNCNTACPQGLGWDCEGTGVAPVPAPAPVDDGCPNAEFSTCGGQGQIVGTDSWMWSGKTCCQDGLECVVHNQWYHQCVRKDA